MNWVLFHLYQKTLPNLKEEDIPRFSPKSSSRYKCFAPDFWTASYFENKDKPFLIFYSIMHTYVKIKFSISNSILLIIMYYVYIYFLFNKHYSEGRYRIRRADMSRNKCSEWVCSMDTLRKYKQWGYTNLQILDLMKQDFPGK